VGETKGKDRTVSVGTRARGREGYKYFPQEGNAWASEIVQQRVSALQKNLKTKRKGQRK